MMARLGDYANIKTGKLDANASSNNGIYPFFTCSKEPLTIDTYSYDCECVLVAGNGDLNVKYYFGKFDAYQRTYIIESNNKEMLFVRYLYYFLDKYVETLRRQSIGGVIKYIKLGNLTEVRMPLPSLDEQRKVADILDRISGLIAKRRQQLDKLDEMIKARFVELFGTFPENEKGWPVGKIRDIVQEVRYGSSRPAVDGGQYLYLRMNNITYNGELDLTDMKRIDVPESELPKCTVRRGDVLFNRTNSKELVGKTCVYDRDEKMVLAGFVIRVRVNEHALPEFLSVFLNMDFSKQMLLGMCKTAIGQANINAQEMQNIEIYIPPMGLQKEFVAFKRHVNNTKTTIRRSLEKLETLKNARMQEYFG